MMGGALVARVAARAAAASILLAVASVGVAAGGEGARARAAPARDAGAVGSRAATIRGGVRAEVRPGEAEGGMFGVANVSCRATAVASRTRRGREIVVVRRAPLQAPRDVFLGEGEVPLALLVPVETGEVAHGAPRGRAAPE